MESEIRRLRAALARRESGRGGRFAPELRRRISGAGSSADAITLGPSLRAGPRSLRFPTASLNRLSLPLSIRSHISPRSRRAPGRRQARCCYPRISALSSERDDQPPRDVAEPQKYSSNVRVTRAPSVRNGMKSGKASTECSQRATEGYGARSIPASLAQREWG